MRAAVVGCGYVADYYLRTLQNYPEVEILSVYDPNKSRGALRAEQVGCGSAPRFEDILQNVNIQLIINLTPPDHHFDIIKRSLTAGKHVFTEKPVCTNFEQALEIFKIQCRTGLSVACAPSTILGDTAQTLWHALRGGAVGIPRLIYAEMDDGRIDQMAFHLWENSHGIPWPFDSEFRTGPILEHASYPLSWITSMFGLIETLTAVSSTLVESKGHQTAGLPPDIAIAVMSLPNKVLARLSCGIVGTRNRSFTVFGDEGVATVEDVWHNSSPVILRKRRARMSDERIDSSAYLDTPHFLPLKRSPRLMHRCGDINDIDYARGIADQVHAIKTGSRSRLALDQAVHIAEIQSFLIRGKASPGTYRTTTTFEAPTPEDWAA